MVFQMSRYTLCYPSRLCEGFFVVEKSMCLYTLSIRFYLIMLSMFNRVSDALYRTVGKLVTLAAIIAGIAFVFRFIKQLLQDRMREKKMKKMIRYYFREKKRQEQLPPQQ
jgi:uncharacterized membrane protein YdjX (TVP38/TMEM64 family)